MTFFLGNRLHKYSKKSTKREKLKEKGQKDEIMQLHINN